MRSRDEPILDPEIARALDKVLIDHLTPRLKQHLDALLHGGRTKGEILQVLRRTVRRTFRGQNGQLTLAAVEAYLETRS
jgi:hypothetical protein